MKRIKFIVLGAVLLGCIVMGTMFFVSYAALTPEEGKICDGVYIDSVNVGGMTEEEAKQAMDSYVATMKDKSVAVKLNENSVTATLQEMGFTCQENEYIKEAMDLGKTGNILTRYKELKDVQNGTKVFSMSYDVDKKTFNKFITRKCAEYCKPAKNAGIERKNGQFIYTEAEDGYAIDQDKTIMAIQKALQAAKGTGEVTAVAVVTKDTPDVDITAARLCKDKLASFSTNYSTGLTARCKNLANAASLINGSVVYPGETFSVYETISPIEVSNGYAMAASYENGEVVETPGGGVCQVSTTLYNTVLRSELQVVQRSPHSMRVSYVQPSMDAAIAGTYKDFKFKNNTDAPIYIAGYAGGGTITFTVFGHETRAADRSIRFVSEVTGETQPGKDRVTKDPTQPKTYKKVTQSAHIGATAKLWKIITENGKETKVQINSSSYNPSPRFITVGTKKVDKDKDKDKDKDSDGKDTDKDNQTPTSPTPTASPQATAKPSV